MTPTVSYQLLVRFFHTGAGASPQYSAINMENSSMKAVTAVVPCRYVPRRVEPSRDGWRYIACDLELSPIKNSFCAFLVRVKTYIRTKN